MLNQTLDITGLSALSPSLAAKRMSASDPLKIALNGSGPFSLKRDASGNVIGVDATGSYDQADLEQLKTMLFDTLVGGTDASNDIINNPSAMTPEQRALAQSFGLGQAGGAYGTSIQKLRQESLQRAGGSTLGTYLVPALQSLVGLGIPGFSPATALTGAAGDLGITLPSLSGLMGGGEASTAAPASTPANPDYFNNATASAGVSDTGYGALTGSSAPDWGSLDAGPGANTVTAAQGAAGGGVNLGTLASVGGAAAGLANAGGGGSSGSGGSVGGTMPPATPMMPAAQQMTPADLQQAGLAETAPGSGQWQIPGDTSGSTFDVGTLTKLLSSGAGLGALAGGALGGLAGSSKPAGTTTTVQDIPDWLKPYVVGNLNAAGTALNKTTQNNGLMDAALPEYLKTVNGAYLDPATNPYLDATYKHAAGLVGAGVDSRFEAAGRYGSGAHQGVLQEGLNNLGTSIYGGNYQQERSRQAAAVGGVPSFNASATNAAFAPYTAYSGLFPNVRSTTTPYFSNPLGGILSGAAAGSALGGILGK